jgi:polygalacturonase
MVPDREGPTGRIKFGTESNGGFKKITIANCIFEFCRGLALETVDGGILEDVIISNIVMRDIINSPFFLRLGGRMRGPANTPVGELRRINIENVVVYNADSRFSSIISGLPGNDIEDVRLSNISIWYKPMEPVDQGKIQQIVPEHEKTYPEPQKFGIIPSYGFFIRHAKNIEMNNVTVKYLENETRPAMILIDVKGIEMRNVDLMKSESSPLISAESVTGFSLKDCKNLKDVSLQEVVKQSF